MPINCSSEPIGYKDCPIQIWGATNVVLQTSNQTKSDLGNAIDRNEALLLLNTKIHRIRSGAVEWRVAVPVNQYSAGTKINMILKEAPDTQ
jgi:hypothetical protein